MKMAQRAGRFLALLGVMALLAGCATTQPDPADWAAWKAKRQESVAGTNGWTTLIGLHWLKEGTNTVGSSPTSHVVLSPTRAAAYLGAFVRTGEAVRFDAGADVIATVENQPVRTVLLRDDRDGPPTRLVVEPLSFVVIARGERLGLRIRDPDSSARARFEGLQSFPYDPGWRLEGRFEPFPEKRTLRVPSMIGGFQEYISPGAIVFQRDGREFRLDVVIEPEESDYFVIFKDATAGKTTYPSGRFLYVTPPGSDGRVIIDFNRAYTPPCGFTAFATCPLPPPQNRLPFEILAGELKPTGHPEP